MASKLGRTPTLAVSATHARRVAFAQAPSSGSDAAVTLLRRPRLFISPASTFRRWRSQAVSIEDHVELKQDSGPNSGEFRSLPDMFACMAERHGGLIAVHDPHRPETRPLTYREMYAEMQDVSAGLRALGLSQGNVVSQFSDNSSRWLIVDQGIMLAGAANAVRGSSASESELMAIYEHSRSCAVVLQDASLLSRLAPHLADAAGLKFVLLLWGEPGADAQAALPGKIHTYEQVRQAGAAGRSHQREPPPSVSRQSLATIVYTSGTTAAPKGVPLSHDNILYQVENFSFFIKVLPGDSVLSLLPPWHMYERSVAYHILSRGGKQVYSSIPRFKRDLGQFPPEFFVCVPLVLDTLQQRVMAAIAVTPGLKGAIAKMLVEASRAHIRARRLIRGVAVEWAFQRPPVHVYLQALLVTLATRLLHALATAVVFGKVRKELAIKKAVVCGGASLAPHLDEFFEMIGLPVLNGWGLTETSPVLTCRRVDDPADPSHNVRGTVGFPIPGTELRLVDTDDRSREVPPGQQGLILARGPGVMSGYWNNPAATASAFVDGFYVTGDLGRLVPEGVNLMGGQLILTGRAKDSITLASGENVEPQPIEDAICCSPIIKYAMLLGHDKRTLGCLVCLDPEPFAAYLRERGDTRPVEQISPQQLRNAVLAEVRRMADARQGRRVWEVITEVQVLREAFSFENGALTRTMKVRRDSVLELYQQDVAALLGRLR